MTEIEKSPAQQITDWLCRTFAIERLSYADQMTVAQNMHLFELWTEDDFKAYPKFRKAHHPKTAKYLQPSLKLWHFLENVLDQRDSARIWNARREERRRQYRRDTGREVAEEVPAAAEAVLAMTAQLRRQIENQ